MAKMKWMRKPKPKLHMVSLSGGKDSTAMLLRMIEEGMRIDIILFCDTGMEFPQMYRHLEKLEKDTGRKITRIGSYHTFEYLMLQHELLIKQKRNEHYENKHVRGYGWPGPKNRWCTKELKDIPRERFLKPLREQYDIIEYVGIAADEGYRLERKVNRLENSRHPIVEWNMTETDCLRYCYDRGYDWEGLYNHFDSVSCWCCPLQPLADLRKLREHFPTLWETLKEWETCCARNIKPDYSVQDLEDRFIFEDGWVRSGKETKGKEFYSSLKNYLEERRCTRK